ncbi:phage tail protein [Serratia marcescens]|nr:phage tail protein [Serratia marcescens]MBI6126519.1 phage tail protein [Serratia marcescens]MBN5300889.1 phage tail protein [Serratia marcescens]
MSQTAITFAFEQWKAKEAVNGSRVVLDEFVFANVPGLDAGKPIDRKEGMPPAGQIVHRQAVNKTGVVNNNAVVYSVTLGTEVGDFDFNWIGLVNKASNTVAMIVHAPTQRKVANHAGQQGNAITRSFVMEYDGAASETVITTPAETWQIDFTARLGGIDEMQRLINRDHYGAGAFFGNGFLVAKAGAQYFVTAGTGYVGGLRAVLAANQNITVTAKPIKVWADVSLQGNVVSQWAAAVKFTVAATAADYTDNAGFKHYVFAVASIDAAGNITDLRPQGSLSDQAGNDAYLRKDDNLASLKDKAKSRGSLGLGTAATRNVGVEGGNVMEVGAFGLGMGARHRDDAYCNQGEIYRLNNASKNAPGNQVYGVLSLPCDGGPSGGYLAVQNNADAFIGRSNIPDNGVTWFQVYTTKFKPKAQDVDAVSATQGGEFKKEIQASGGVMVANSWKAKPGGLFPGNGDGASYETCNVDLQSWYGLGFFNTCKAEGIQGRTAFLNVRTGSFSAKGRITGASVWDGDARVYSPANKPTAADVGALTDAQAAQKYALRSIRVNGKPLTGDVNLLASDVNAWNKTEADGRFVKQAGDTMTGPLTVPRIVFPDGSTANADSDVNRPNGFTVESLAEATNKGYPVPGGMGILFTGKANEFRNAQFLVGSGDRSFYLRSMRKDSPGSTEWARVYTTDYKPTISDVKAADHSNNFAARMGVARVLTGAEKPTSPGVWSVENSSWTPVAWGTLYVATNGTNLSTASGNGKFIHYLFIAHGTANKFYVATDVNGGFTGWESYLPRKGGQLSGALTSSAEITAKYLSTPTGAPPEGSGTYSEQLDTKAPFYQENYNWDVAEGGRYVPLVKGKSTRKGQGYPTAVSFGYLMDGAGSFAKPCIHVRGDNNAEAIWRFDPNTKQFVAPGNLVAGGAVYQNDGNIKGSIWGGYLSNWLNNQINGRVDWGSYNRDVGARATIDYVNSRSAVAGGRNAWWYKDEVTGFIIQGGVVNRVDYVNRVGFPRAYARECFGVQLTLASSNGNWFGDSRVNIQARDLDNNGFNAMMDGQEQVVFWQSVGV